MARFNASQPGKLAALVLLALSLTQQLTAAEQSFPYMAYVVHTDAYVRSGPGQRYYPTQQLPQGFALEVFRHDGDGWCAIRPPEGSFSWVAAHEVRLVAGDTAEVIADKTVTRVGSSLSPSRSAVQVLLQKGERVRVAPRGPQDDPNWLRVVPPAGEFRWISASDLGRQAPVEFGNRAAPTGNKWTRARLPGETNQPDEPQQTSHGTNVFDHLRSQTSNAASFPQTQASPVTTIGGGHVEIVAGIAGRATTSPVPETSTGGAGTRLAATTHIGCYTAIGNSNRTGTNERHTADPFWRVAPSGFCPRHKQQRTDPGDRSTAALVRDCQPAADNLGIRTSDCRGQHNPARGSVARCSPRGARHPGTHRTLPQDSSWLRTDRPNSGCHRLGNIADCRPTSR